MLPLVVADRDDVGLVQQDVPGHQDRVREEPRRDEVAALALLLELGHPAQLAVARDGREQPRRLRVRGHVALAERRRAGRVEPRREQERRQVERAAAEVLRVVLDGDRVQVDDAEEAVPALLGGRVLAEAADQVAEMLGARGLDAGEDPHPVDSPRSQGRKKRPRARPWKTDEAADAALRARVPASPAGPHPTPVRDGHHRVTF
jgi:hypothetical protein